MKLRIPKDRKIPSFYDKKIQVFFSPSREIKTISRDFKKKEEKIKEFKEEYESHLVTLYSFLFIFAFNFSFSSPIVK